LPYKKDSSLISLASRLLFFANTHHSLLPC
jgi:hypothetical protein